MTARALVLTFHAVGETGIPEKILKTPADMRYTIPVESLECVLSLLDHEKVVTVRELAEKKEGDWTVLTFDDGFASDYLNSFPLLKSRGFRATFYVNADNIGGENFTDSGMLTEMAFAGMEIGSHGMSHRYLSTLPEWEAVEEISRSKKAIEDKLSIGVSSFAAVGGHASQREIGIAWSAGYKTFATMKPGRTPLSGENMVVRRNHFQAGCSAGRIRGITLGSPWSLAAGQIRYRLLEIPKKVLGLDGYDRAKTLLLGWNRHKP